MKPMIHLAGRVFNTPLMIHRPKLDAIMRVIGPRLGVQSSILLTDKMSWDDEYPLPEKREQAQQPSGPVAIIPVHGSLVKRGDYMDSLSGLTSYDSLRADVAAAMADPNVKSLLFDIDSPGGEAAGCFDFADWLVSQSGVKPFIGISNDAAYSAAYAIASCMDTLFVTGIGGVGSIGVYALHVDQSEYDKQLGVTYTYVSSGDKKVDGNPHEPLSKGAMKEMQDHVDKIRDMFVELVATNRQISTEKVYDTEAALFMGGDGIPMLADTLGAFDDAVEFAMNAAVAKRSVAMPGIEVRTTNKIEIHNNDLKFKMWAINKHHALQNLRGSGFKPGAVLKFGEDVYIDKSGPFGAESYVALRNEGTIKLSTKDILAPYGRISGILAPYGKLSCDLGGFKEVYEQGCFKKSIENGDPLILAYHDPSKPLGRKSAGTARFWEEADGLHYEVDLPDTQDGRDLKTSIERGDVKGASAAFFIDKYRWEVRGGDRVRVVEQGELVEGSPHSFTAYDDTTADSKQAAAAAQDELTRVRLRLLALKNNR